MFEDIGELVQPGQFASGNEAAVVYANAAYNTELKQRGVELFRREAEQIDRVNDVLVYSSLMGGTGSGLTAKLTDKLKEDFGKLNDVYFTVVPGENLC